MLPIDLVHANALNVGKPARISSPPEEFWQLGLSSMARKIVSGAHLP
jgi:hypothetical protein